MTALTFTLTTALKQRLDVSPLTPDQLNDKTLTGISSLLLQCGNRQIRADEIFTIEGQESHQVIFKNANAKLDFIGKGMTHGEIQVEGNAGSYLGMQLKGGKITVDGSVDAFAACEMKKGEILIKGSAGDFLGAALPGNKKGMSGGIVIVKGPVGDRTGDHMRRGVILIEGNAGSYLGSRMTAGTIAVLGTVGDYLGYAMNRGTLLLAQTPSAIPPTFNDCGTHTLGFIPLLLNSFQNRDTRFTELSDTLKRVRRYAGDWCGLGKGEILVVV